MEYNANVYSAIIEHLDLVKRRPPMYCGEMTERAVVSYLAAFNTACGILGCPPDAADPQGIYHSVCSERGWELNAHGPQKRMRDAGWDDAAVINELLEIEIETWRQISRAALMEDAT